MSALDQAIRLSARFPVFPLRADKKPACKHGFLDATQSPADIVELWGNSNAPLIGIPTGEKSGISVLDIDPRHGGDLWLEESIDSLPITRTHKTGSGGKHFLFRHIAGIKNSESKIAPGVDTRGQGGYCVWWPAAGLDVENASILEDWPKWLWHILNPPVARRPVALPATREEADARASLMIERAYDRVRNAGPGQRHYQLRAAACTLGGLTRFLGKNMEQIESDLVELIMQTGASDRKNAEKTAKWAVTRGSSGPLLARS